MTNLSILYNLIEDPLNEKVVKKLVSIYANGTDVYSFLVCSDNKQEYGQINLDDYAELYINIYNKWISNVINLSLDDFITLRKRNIIDIDFSELRKKLMDLKCVKSIGDVESLIADPLVKKYTWEVNDTKWNCFCSDKINYLKETGFPVDVRLYLNPSSCDVHRLANIFINKCYENGMPFDIKFDNVCRRDDCFVIYSSTKNLFMYLKILNEIEDEYQEIVCRCSPPPVLTGQVNNWIGIGAEPNLSDNKSFNELRSEIISESIHSSAISYILNKIDTKIQVNRIDIPFSMYLADKYVEYIIDIAKREPSYRESIGLTKNQLDNIYIRNELREKLELSLTNYIISNGNSLGDSKNNIEEIINVGKSGTILIDKESINSFLKKCVQDLLEYSDMFDNIVGEVRNGFLKYGISPVKTCFNIDTREKFLQEDLLVDKKNFEQKQEMKKQELSDQLQSSAEEIFIKSDDVEDYNNNDIVFDNNDVMFLQKSNDHLDDVLLAMKNYLDAFKELEEVRNNKNDQSLSDIRVNIAEDKLMTVLKK